jgi:ankyrin repeat protein
MREAAMESFWDAMQAGDVELVRNLLDADPKHASTRDPGGISPVLYCLFSDRLDLLDLVLGAEPELDVFDAAALGDIASLATLLVSGADLRGYTPDGFTALHVGALFDSSYAVALLLRAGIDPEVESRNGRVRPLHSAVEGRSTGVATALLACGVDADPVQRGGQTPLMIAAQAGDLDLVELLLSCGADPTRADAEGTTAADFAVTAGHASLASRLRRQH